MIVLISQAGVTGVNTLIICVELRAIINLKGLSPLGLGLLCGGVCLTLKSPAREFNSL